jgi:hypothetical protein
MRLFEVHGQQHLRGLNSLDAVRQLWGEHETHVGAEAVLLARGVDEELTFDDLNGDEAVGGVLEELALALEQKRDEGDLSALEQGHLSMTSVALVVFSGEAFEGFVEVEEGFRAGEALGRMGAKAVLVALLHLRAPFA